VKYYTITDLSAEHFLITDSGTHSFILCSSRLTNDWQQLCHWGTMVASWDTSTVTQRGERVKLLNVCPPPNLTDPLKGSKPLWTKRRQDKEMMLY